MYTSIVVDDESAALELISDYIGVQPNLELSRTFSDPLTALAEINKLSTPVDILFVDIEMPKMNGINLASLLKHKTRKLIFTTAHTKYAFESYELEADGYLLKPFSHLKFTQLLERILTEPNIQIIPKKNTHDFILLKSQGHKKKYIKILTSNIIAIESQNKEVKIYTGSEIIFAHVALTTMLKSLMHLDNFVQIHKSFVISKYNIKGIERKFVILDNGLKLPIGRAYKEFYEDFIR